MIYEFILTRLLYLSDLWLWSDYQTFISYKFHIFYVNSKIRNTFLFMLLRSCVRYPYSTLIWKFARFLSLPFQRGVLIEWTLACGQLHCFFYMAKLEARLHGTFTNCNSILHWLFRCLLLSMFSPIVV